MVKDKENICQLQEQLDSDPLYRGMMATCWKDHPPHLRGIGIRDDVTGCKHAMVFGAEDDLEDISEKLMSLALEVREKFMPPLKSAVEIMEQFDALPLGWRALVQEYGMLQVMLALTRFDEGDVDEAREWLEGERKEKENAALMCRAG